MTFPAEQFFSNCDDTESTVTKSKYKSLADEINEFVRRRDFFAAAIVAA